MAKEKVYVSPSSQTDNKYAVGDTTEAAQCRKIAKALVKALKRCGFDAMTNVIGDMYARVKESNKWGANLHIPIHTNAHNKKVKGTRLFCFSKNGEGYKACKAIMAALAPITPGSSDSITVNKVMYENRVAKAPTAYVEVAFHDNAEEARWIIDHTEDIAEAICKGVCNYYGMKYVASVAAEPVKPEVPKAESKEKLYRVFDKDGKQIGAYKEETNAFDQVKKQLKATGSVKITYGEK